VESSATDKPVQREIRSLLSGERLILRETKRAVTPFGGLAVFLSFLGRIGFVEKLRQHMPVCWRSPNQIEPTATLMGFLMTVLVGGKRFAHAGLLRGDRALHALMGIDRFPTDDTIRNLFRRFGMGQVQRLFEPLLEWQMERSRVGLRADRSGWQGAHLAGDGGRVGPGRVHAHWIGLCTRLSWNWRGSTSSHAAAKPRSRHGHLHSVSRPAVGARKPSAGAGCRWARLSAVYLASTLVVMCSAAIALRVLSALSLA
jgi:hypothetical protein